MTGSSGRRPTSGPLSNRPSLAHRTAGAHLRKCQTPAKIIRFAFAVVDRGIVALAPKVWCG